jgi:serine/threonine-protein kinase RsbW
MRVPADLAHLARLGAWVRESADHAVPGDQDMAWRVELAVHEVATNIVRHAYGPTPTGDIEADISCAGDDLVVVLRDRGRSFEPERVTPPDPDHPRVGGYGLTLIDRLADEVDYQRLDGGNHWRLTFRPHPDQTRRS